MIHTDASGGMRPSFRANRRGAVPIPGRVERLPPHVGAPRARTSRRDDDHAWMSAGSGWFCTEPAAIAPQRLPSTMIGVATAELIPAAWARTPIGVEQLSASLSIRAERPVSNTIVPRLFQSIRRLARG